MKLFERIRLRREELGLSQTELARKLDYQSRSSINKIEQGINDIPQSKIVEFAKALQCTPAYLMGWDDSENINTEDKQKLTENQKEIVSIFDRLTEEKQVKVIGYAEALLPDETDIPYKLVAFGGVNEETEPPIEEITT